MQPEPTAARPAARNARGNRSSRRQHSLANGARKPSRREQLPPASQQQKLAEIFGSMHLSELPALASHVNELLELCRQPTIRAEQLAAVILKDYSLTNKVLQVVNSAFYSRGVPITTVERAVAALGIDTIREMASTISLVEQFFRRGVEKDGLSRLLALSFLSAKLSRTLAHCKRLPVLPEEAFVCSLLHHLGRVVILVYLPDIYHRIETAKGNGGSEEIMTRLLLRQLSFAEVGVAIGRFWGFSETLLATMASDPGLPASPLDHAGCLHHLTLFSNRLTWAIAEGKDPALLLSRYATPLKYTPREPLRVLYILAEKSTSTSTLIRSGINRLKMRSKLLVLLKDWDARSLP